MFVYIALSQIIQIVCAFWFPSIYYEIFNGYLARPRPNLKTNKHDMNIASVDFILPFEIPLSKFYQLLFMPSPFPISVEWLARQTQFTPAQHSQSPIIPNTRTLFSHSPSGRWEPVCVMPHIRPIEAFAASSYISISISISIHLYRFETV